MLTYYVGIGEYFFLLNAKIDAIVQFQQKKLFLTS